MNRIAGILLAAGCIGFAACGGGGGQGTAGLAVSQTALSFGSSVGTATNPPPVSVNVTSSGGALAFTAMSDSPWLSVTPGAGNAPQSVQVSVALGTLSVNSYTGHITLISAITCTTTNPNGFEWCINMPAVDLNGNVYATSEDGNVYVLPQGNTGVFTTPTANMFLNLAVGAAYTPLSIGPDGLLYLQNDGHMFVVGN
ncbi:MAG: hypothetical protein ABSG27_07235 [Candidatus Acidiferrales bacterium]